jgi:penicillin-binding protein 2
MNAESRSFRALVFVLSVGFLFVLISLRVAYLSVFAHERARAAINQQVISEEPIAHQRGRILDRSGEVIVDSRPSIDLWVDGRRVLMTGPRFSELARRYKLPISSLDEPRRLLGIAALAGSEKPVIIKHQGVPPKRGKDLPGVTYKNGEIRINPRLFPSSEGIAYRLARYLNLDDRRRTGLARAIEKSGNLERLLVTDLSEAAWHRIGAELSVGQMRGLLLREGMRRAYRYGRVAYHVLGYLNEVSEDELKKFGGALRGGELVGRVGIERHMESMLRGVDGARFVIRNSRGAVMRGQWVDEMLGDRPWIDPVKGHDVELTIDLALQQRVEKVFKHRRGAVVVIDTRNGEILALASFPRPNPNRIRHGAYNRAITHHQDKPMVNRVLAEHYAPASTFKVVTALAALESGTVNSETWRYCPGKFELAGSTWACWKRQGHGSLDLVGALRHSCNVYFYKIADRMGMKPILSVAKELGLGETAGLSIGPEITGVLPTDAYCRQRKFWVDARGRKRRLSCTSGDAVNAAIGQGFVTVTPYQLALAYARIASGKRIEPRIVRRVVAQNTREVESYSDENPPKLNFKREHLDLIREGLRAVVNDPRGTAYRTFYNAAEGKGAARLRAAGIEVSGKTGTAQVRAIKRDSKGRAIAEAVYAGRDHAWFAGYAPADNPVMAVAVLVEHGGSGGRAAAPIAFEVMAAVLVPKDEG